MPKITGGETSLLSSCGWKDCSVLSTVMECARPVNGTDSLQEKPGSHNLSGQMKPGQCLFGLQRALGKIPCQVSFPCNRTRQCFSTSHQAGSALSCKPAIQAPAVLLPGPFWKDLHWPSDDQRTCSPLGALQVVSFACWGRGRRPPFQAGWPPATSRSSSDEICSVLKPSAGCL